MARLRIATDDVFQLRKEDVLAALENAIKAGNATDFYTMVEMRNPSRSYWVRHNGRDFSLKAVVAWALRKTKPSLFAKDFHAADASLHLRNLGFQVGQGPPERPF
jgi:hypothetical protein